MESTTNEITHDFPPFFKAYKDGRIERYEFASGHSNIPATLDSQTGVQSKDIVISPESGVSARIFLPTTATTNHQKLPLVVHYHGGGFCGGSPFDQIASNFLTSLVLQANVIAISIDYRLAPENPLPIAYDDSWAGLKWVAAHSNGLGPEQWMNDYADLGRVFLAGESAGANIAHYVAVRAGSTRLVGVKIVGLLIVHPFFGGKEEDKMYKFMCPTSSGCDDDPKLNPAVDPDLVNLGCDRVLVMVAENDWLRDRGVAYYETLRSSKWGGSVEFYENKGEGHCFHMFNPNGAKDLMNRLVEFITRE